MRPELFRDLFLSIIHLDHWTSLTVFLRHVPRLNTLFIAIDSFDEDIIQAASPKIVTKISLLQVHDHEDQRATISFAIWSSFLNVSDYSVCCDCEGPTFQAAQAWAKELSGLGSSSWRLRLTNVTSPQVLKAFSRITHLAFRPRHWGDKIDLEELRQVVESDLQHLEIMSNPEPNDGPPNEIACISFIQLDTLLNFPKIETVRITNLHIHQRPDFVREMEGWKPFRAWPTSLRQIKLSFRKPVTREEFEDEDSYYHELTVSSFTIVEKIGHDFKIRHHEEIDHFSFYCSHHDWKSYYLKTSDLYE